MRKFIYSCIAAFALNVSVPARASWGADIPILLEILANSVSQLYQLYEMVQNGQQTLYLMRDLHRGINDALGVVSIIREHPDAGMYGDWTTVERALRNLQSIYGSVPQSANADIHQNTDRSVAEAINLNNNLFAYADELDRVGERIDNHSRSVSPKGAAKLTAQSLGVVVRAMNQQLRAQAASLKLQAQSLAVKNRQDKEETREFVKTTSTLSASMKHHNSQFQTPRF